MKYVLCIDRAENWHEIVIGTIYLAKDDVKNKDGAELWVLETLGGRRVPESYKWQFIELNQKIFQLL